MDRAYYYRLLGLQEGATQSQISQAYKERVRKLKSPDYADDYEYMKRKLKEAEQAYEVLTGGKPAGEIRSSKGYKVANGSRKASKEAKRSQSFERIKDTEKNKKSGVNFKGLLGVIFAIILALISNIGSCSIADNEFGSYEITSVPECASEMSILGVDFIETVDVARSIDYYSCFVDWKHQDYVDEYYKKITEEDATVIATELFYAIGGTDEESFYCDFLEEEQLYLDSDSGLRRLDYLAEYLCMPLLYDCLGGEYEVEGTRVEINDAYTYYNFLINALVQGYGDMYM